MHAFVRACENVEQIKNCMSREALSETSRDKTTRERRLPESLVPKRTDRPSSMSQLPGSRPTDIYLSTDASPPTPSDISLNFIDKVSLCRWTDT